MSWQRVVQFDAWSFHGSSVMQRVGVGVGSEWSDALNKCKDLTKRMTEGSTNSGAIIWLILSHATAAEVKVAHNGCPIWKNWNQNERVRVSSSWKRFWKVQRYPTASARGNTWNRPAWSCMELHHTALETFWIWLPNLAKVHDASNFCQIKFGRMHDRGWYDSSCDHFTDASLGYRF